MHLLEEMQQNLDEAHARASETERRLCHELEDYTYSWDREIGRPNNLSDTIWQMMQSGKRGRRTLLKKNSQKFWRTHQLKWNETAKAIKVWVEKEDDEIP